MAYTKFLRFATLGLLVTTLLVPFIVADGNIFPNMFFPYITGKNFAFRILVELLLGVYVLLALREPKYRPRASWLFYALTGFLGWMALATIFSADPSKSFWSNFERMEGYIGLLHMFAYAIIAGAVLSAEAWWERFFRISIGLAALQGLYAFFQVIRLFGIAPSAQSGVRADGTFGNATYLAVYMLFNIFLTLYMLLRDRRSGMAQVAYGLALVLMLGGIFYTETRGTLLGLVGGLIIAAGWILWSTRSEAQWHTLRRVCAWGLGAIAALTLLFLSVRHTAFVQQSPTLQRFAGISLSDKTTQSRFILWHMAFEGIAAKPVLGWGQENFSFVFNKYYEPAMYSQEQWFDRAHNAFIDWLIAGGLPAFLLYVSLFVLTAFLVLRSSLSGPEQAVFFGLLGAYAFNNLLVFDNLVSYLYFFLLIAFAHGLSTRKPHGWMFLSRPMSDHGIAVAAPVVLIATVGLLWGMTLPGLARAEQLLNSILTVTPVMTPSGLQGAPKDAKDNLAEFKDVTQNPWSGYGLGQQEAVEQFLQFAISTAAQSASMAPELKQQFYTSTRDAGLTILAVRPHDARLELFMGTFLSAFGQSPEALQYYAQAVADSPRKQQILIQIGVEEIHAGRMADALGHLKTAYDESPDYDTARVLYAAGLFYAGQKQAADALLTERYGTVLVDDARMIQVYNDTKQYDRVLGIWQAREAASPNDPQMHIGVASAYFMLGNKVQTIAELNKAAELNPSLAGQVKATITQIQSGTLKAQ